MLEVHDKKNTSLSFGCLITQICLQVVIDISDSEPRSRILDPLGIQTLMKSNAQLWHEAQGIVPQPPPDLPTTAASSSQAVPPINVSSPAGNQSYRRACRTEIDRHQGVPEISSSKAE
jgi:hypothetical protein